jgi:RND family efflux transporter MFP subunit
MKNTFAHFWSILKVYLRKWWVITGIIVIALIGFFSVRGSSTQAQDEVIIVKSATISEGVSVTGKVKASQAVDLSFERSGKVTRVAKVVGEEVKAGETIVQIDSSDVLAELAQAQAALRVQQSKLNELEVGTRPEQLEITKTKLASAKVDLGVASTTFVAALQNAYTSADDAIRNKVDIFFINPRSANPQIAFTSTVTSETSLESGRVEVENRLKEMKNLLEAVTPASNPDLIAAEVKQDLGEIKLFLDNLALTVNALTPNSYASETTIATWKANVSAARTSVNTAITTILTSEDKYHAAQTTHNIALQQLNLDTSGTVSQSLDAQRAQVASAQASVAAVQSRLAKTVIKAPISGIVTKQDAIIGEIAPAGVTIVSVMTDSQFQIEANIPEADIAKVKSGQSATVTLDAYSTDDIFNARVVTVDPAETVIDGVPTYKTTFQFEGSDDRIKSGMTANVEITGEVRENVLTVPQRAISSKNGKRYVTVKVDENTKTETEVKVGIRGMDGSVEILEGISEGQQIIISQK